MRKLKLYIEEAFKELMTKVTWPTWPELQNSAIIVMIASLIISLIIFVMDFTMGINSDKVFWKGVLGILYDLLGPNVT